jgi:hypothetical protein
VANADVAWVDVLPSARNFLPQLQQAVTPAAAKAGEAAGRQFGSSFGSSSTSSVESASTKMSTALRKVADAAGQVRVAEEKLNSVRASARSDGAQIAAAEERLASARRNEIGANEQLAAATRRVSSAQNEHAAAVRGGSAAMEESTGRAGRVSAAFGGMRNAVATGFAAFYGAKVAVDFIGSTVGASRDLNEEINKSSVVFGKNAGEVLNWSKTTATSLGTSREQALAATGQFGNLFSAIGLTTDVSSSMSIRLVQLAGDLASFNNANPSDVLEAMRAGLVGETEPMRRFGVDISDASMRAEALKEGLNVGPVLTQGQKAQLAYQIMLNQTKVAQGDFARTSDSLANSQRILSATWDDAKARLGSLLVGPATAFVHWLTDAIPKVFEFGHWIGENVNWLGPLAGIILGVAAAVKVWSVGQAILNAVMEANPIIRIIGIIAALVVALVSAYQTSDTFRAIVQNAFHAVADAGQWMWENVLKPTWAALVAAWTAVSDGVQWAWQRVIQPTWNAVAAAGEWLWTNVLQPVFAAISAAWSAMSTAISWAWDNVLNPVWTVLKAVAQALAIFLAVVIFGPTAVAWLVMSTAIEFAWNNILHPVWVAVETAANWLWNNVLHPIWIATQAGWSALVTAMVWAWDNILHPMWNAVSTGANWLWNTILAPIFSAIGAGWDALVRGMSWVHDHILQPMWQALKDALGSVQTAFDTVKRGIETVWNGVMDVVATPINFVIEVVFNRGLFTAWNWVVDTLGLPSAWHAPHWNQLPRGTQFADGGPVPAYAGGGPIPGPYRGPRADNMPGYVPMAGGGFAPIRVNPREFIQPVSAVERYGTGFMESVRTGRFPLGLAQGFADGGVWRKLDAWRAANLPGSVLTSAYRAGASDYHGSGEAIDIGVPGNVQSTLDTMALKVLNAWSFANEIIHKPNASVKNGQRTNPPAPWGQATWDQHANHIHLAVTAANLAGHDGGGGGLGSGLSDISQVWDKLTGSISAVGEMAGRFGNNGFVQMMAKLPVSLLGKMWDTVKDTISNAIQTVVTSVVGGNTLMTGTGRVKDDVQAVANRYGWGTGAEWAAIDWIVGKESSWNPTAQNPRSSASGLFQMIDGTWAAYRPASASAFAHMRQASVPDQAAAGMRYIGSRYVHPVAAQRFWEEMGYYGGGGQVPYFHGGGGTHRWKREHPAMLSPDERVLSPRQDDYFRRFVEGMEGGGYGGPGTRAPLVGQVVQSPGESTEAFVDRLWHKVKVADRGGVYTFTS